MWGRAIKNDAVFLKFIKHGWIKVFKSGLVVNKLTGNKIGGNKPDVGGYFRVYFTSPKTKKRYRIMLHRLVWLAFKGKIPINLQINHKDGDKSNNRLKNLELATSSENIIHSFKVLGKTVAKGGG